MLRTQLGQLPLCKTCRARQFAPPAAGTCHNQPSEGRRMTNMVHSSAPAPLEYSLALNRNRHPHFMRLRAVPIADVAQIGEQAAELLAILGIAIGGVFVALWNIEKQSKQSAEQEVAQLKEQLVAAQQEVVHVQQQLVLEQQARKEAESWRPRLDDAQTELFKLEKALEMKDAQLATFMTTAHRQIRSLEDSVKELQKL